MAHLKNITTRAVIPEHYQKVTVPISSSLIKQSFIVQLFESGSKSALYFVIGSEVLGIVFYQQISLSVLSLQCFVENPGNLPWTKHFYLVFFAAAPLHWASGKSTVRSQA